MRKQVVVASVVGLLALVGLLAGEFWVKVATEALIMTLLAASFSLLYGYAGMLSFGQGAFFAVGAYGFGLAMTRLNLSFPLCIAVGVLAATIWALLTGFLCVRLAGIYFAIMTVVVAQSTFYVLFQWYDFTGGDNGIQGLVPPGPLAGTRAYYYFVLVITALAYYAYYRLVRSPFGRSLQCIKENRIRARFVGIDERKHALEAFVISGFLAGLSGVLFGPFTRTVVPQMADWISSGKAVFMGILGGAAHLLGPVVGAMVWVFLDAFVSGYTVHWPLIIGLLVFSIVFFMPGGLTSVISSRLFNPHGETGGQ